MRHWQILKRDDGIENKCMYCVHFYTEESGEADCKYDIDPEWDDDEECWKCERFMDAEEAEYDARCREEDLQVELAIEAWKGMRG